MSKSPSSRREAAGTGTPFTRFAVEEGYGDALVSGLKKIVQADFGDVAPSPALIILEYSHPSLSQRFEAIEKAKG